MKKEKIRVLFVCMGNICRSPTAQGVFAKQVAQSGLGEVIEIDSAGTHAYHVGKAPDPRAQRAAKRRGYDLSRLRARKVQGEDCRAFDYIIVMDEMNLLDVRSNCPKDCWDRIRLFMDFSPQGGGEVPDPYGGESADFERVLDLVEQAARGLLAHIRSTHGV